MTTRTKNDCFVNKTCDWSHVKCSREKCACCARLMGCTVRRFSDTLSCNGFLRAYLSFCFWFDFECITVISKCQGSRTGIPSIREPVNREIISESVELWDTHVCFLHHNLLEQTRDFRIRTMFHLKSISNRDFLQCQNLETVIIWIIGLHFPHDNIIVFTREMNKRDQTY